MITPSLKSLILSASTIISGTIFWYLYAAAVQSAAKDLIVGSTFVMLSVYLVCLSLSFLLLRTYLLFLATLALSTLPLLLFVQFSWIYLVATAIFIAAGMRSFQRVKDEITHRTDFHVPELLRRGLPYFLTFLSLMMALVYYMEAGKTADITTQRFLSRPAYDRLITLARPSVLDRVLPGFDPESSVDEYIGKRLQEEGIDLNELPPAERETILAEARRQLSLELNVNMAGDEKLKDLLYKIITTRGETYIDSYKSFVPFAFALGFFLFLRAAAFPYSLLVTLATWGIVRLFLHWHVIQKRQETTVQDKMAWN